MEEDKEDDPSTEISFPRNCGNMEGMRRADVERGGGGGLPESRRDFTGQRSGKQCSDLIACAPQLSSCFLKKKKKQDSETRTGFKR